MLETYSHLDFGEGSAYEPTQENFPCAKILFKPDDWDAVGLNITEHYSGTNFKLAAGGQSTAAANQPGTDGSIAFTSVGDLVYFIIATTTDPSTQLFYIGDSGAHYVGLNAAAAADPLIHLSGNVVVNVDSTATTGEISRSANYFGAKATTNGSLTSFDNKAASAQHQELAGVSIPAFVNSQLGNYLTIQNLSAGSFYGLMVFDFAGGVPGDLGAGFQWMAQKWKINKHYIYPGWKGL